MMCHACGRILSNDPKEPNFGLWTEFEPRWIYCAPMLTCPGCGCVWELPDGKCPECGSQLQDSEIGGFTNFCARTTLADHREEVGH